MDEKARGSLDGAPLGRVDEPVLRDASAGDRDWLYGVHRAAMRDYVDDTWGWDEAWQARHFAERFKPRALQVIQHGGVDVGFCSVSAERSQIVLETIELLPNYQGRGIGSICIRALMRRAATRKVPIVLQVLKTNVRAKALYERLGFEVIGETETHHRMHACP